VTQADIQFDASVEEKFKSMAVKAVKSFGHKSNTFTRDPSGLSFNFEIATHEFSATLYYTDLVSGFAVSCQSPTIQVERSIRVQLV
jgi:hypothetical protein